MPLTLKPQVRNALMAFVILGAVAIALTLFKRFSGISLLEGFGFDESEVDKALASDKKSMVFFYAPWCGHCKNAKPDFNQLQNFYDNNKHVGVFKVNCDERKDLAKKYGIKGFPTIRYFPNGPKNVDDFVEYNRDRSFNSLKSFLEEHQQN